MSKTPPWKVPEIWPGSTVFILGGGPSISLLSKEYLAELNHRKVIAVNNAWELGDFDFLYFGDMKWWLPHWGNREKVIERFNGIILCSALNTVGMGPLVNFLMRGRPQGIDERRTHISWNGNSGLSAITIARHLGAKQIVLLGFDMRKVKDEKNYHKAHKEPVPVGKEMQTRFDVHMRGCPQIAKDAKRMGISIYNATPGSAIPDRFFPIITPEKGLDL